MIPSFPNGLRILYRSFFFRVDQDYGRIDIPLSGRLTLSPTRAFEPSFRGVLVGRTIFYVEP